MRSRTLDEIKRGNQEQTTSLGLGRVKPQLCHFLSGWPWSSLLTPWVFASLLIHWDVLKATWPNKYSAMYHAHSKNSSGKRAEEEKEVAINFLAKLGLCPAGTHTEHPLILLAHIFMLPWGRTDHLQKPKIRPFRNWRFKLWEWGSPLSPSSSHPESSGNWREVRKEERDAWTVLPSHPPRGRTLSSGPEPGCRNCNPIP